MKQVILLSYTYPDVIRVKVNSSIYTYRASEALCRHFMNGLNYGLGYHALNYFKKKAELIKKETINGKIKEGKTTVRMLPER